MQVQLFTDYGWLVEEVLIKMRENQIPKGWKRTIMKPELEVYHKGKYEVSLEKYKSAWVFHMDKGNKGIVHSKHYSKESANKRAKFYMKKVK